MENPKPKIVTAERGAIMEDDSRNVGLPAAGGNPTPALLAGRMSFMLVCYLRHADRVFETYWTSGRGVEAMAPSYGLLDMAVYGRQETWEDSPAGWPHRWRIAGEQLRTNGRPTAQWSHLKSGRSDDLGTAGR